MQNSPNVYSYLILFSKWPICRFKISQNGTIPKTPWINSCAKSAWYARCQHSYNICKDFLSHDSWMKNLNFTNSCIINMNWNIYTIFIQLKTTFFEKLVKTINSNNSTKFEVNWWRGSQYTARHTKNRLQFDE